MMCHNYILGQSYKTMMDANSEFIPPSPKDSLLSGTYSMLSFSSKDIEDDLIPLLGKQYDSEFLEFILLLVV